MKKVWVVYGDNDYDNGTLIGVFDTEKLAQFVHDHYDENSGQWRFKDHANDLEYDLYFDSVTVFSMELNKVQPL